MGIEEENRYTIENFINNHNYFYRFNKSTKWSKLLKEKIKSSHLEMYKNTKKVIKIAIHNEIVIAVFSFIPILTMGLFAYFKLFGLNLEVFIFLSLMVSVWMKNITDIFSTVPNYDTAKNLVIDFDIREIETEANEETLFFDTLLIKNSDINKSFSFNQHKKIKIAIVGKSGSGKTSLVEKMMNYNSDSDYEIFWNNISNNKINKETIKENITYVDFDNYLFEGTIKENITLFDDIKNPKIYSVLKMLNLEYLDINKNVENIDLSQGEIQRLKLARAFLYKKNILILDEAFSNIEPKLASKIRTDLISQYNCFIEVSHHLTNEELNNYDYILRLDNI